VYGPCSTVTSKGFISLEISPESEEGEEVNQPNAAGEQCINEPGQPYIKWYNVSIEFCQVDFDLFTMMNPTWEKILDEDGDTVGLEESLTIDPSAGFALEYWTDVASIEGLKIPPGATGAWGYSVLQRLVSGIIEDRTIENDAISFTLTGKTLTGGQWGVGPYNVRRAAGTGTPGPLLTPIKPDSPHRSELVTLEPPEALCGCRALSNPAGPTINSLVEGGDPQEVTLTATTTGGRPMTVNWGDGTATAALTSATPTDHTYADPGEYLITVAFSNLGLEATYRYVVLPWP